MGGLARTWESLSMMKRVMLAGVVVATVAAVIAIASMANRPTMALLFAGLDERAAGQVVGQLEQLGVPMEVRGASIYVSAAERDRVRMVLASQGVPSNGQKGYELLDELSGFGTTAEMFDAAYWRAKEGELARTLLAAPGVDSARVHISPPQRRAFSRTPTQPSASITLTGSGAVSRATATSSRYLVALAVPGLAAEQVVVIDSNNGVVLRPGDETPFEDASGQNDRARAMKGEIEALLAARVGEGSARVTVNIETVRETESISRRLIDPESRTLRRTESIELTEAGEDNGGAVTVASNLPDGDAAAGQGRSSEREEARKTDQFDYNETREEILRPAGSIKRISVAILLDEIRGTGPDAVAEPRGAEEIARLETLVKSAIGFDEERGDVVTVDSMAFVTPPEIGTLAAADSTPSFIATHMMQIIQLAALAIVALILGLFVVRPVLLANRGANRLEDSDPALSAIDVTPGGAGANNGATPALEAPPGAAQQGTAQRIGAETGGPEDDPMGALRDAVTTRTEESVDVLKGWLESDQNQRAA